MATSSVLGGQAHSQSSWTAAAKRTVSRQGLLARAWRCCRCQWHGQEPRRSRPPGGITWGALRDMSSSLGQWGAGTTPRGVTRSSRWPIPGKLKRRVLSEERGGCCSPRPSCGYSRATRRGTSHPLNCRRFQPSRRRTVCSKLTQGTERRTPSATALPWCRRRVPPCSLCMK